MKIIQYSSYNLTKLQKFEKISSNLIRYYLTGPSQDLKIRGARSNVLGIMSSPFAFEKGFIDLPKNGGRRAHTPHSPSPRLRQPCKQYVSKKYIYELKDFVNIHIAESTKIGHNSSKQKIQKLDGIAHPAPTPPGPGFYVTCTICTALTNKPVLYTRTYQTEARLLPCRPQTCYSHAQAVCASCTLSSCWPVSPYKQTADKTPVLQNSLILTRSFEDLLQFCYKSRPFLSVSKQQASTRQSSIKKSVELIQFCSVFSSIKTLLIKVPTL